MNTNGSTQACPKCGAAVPADAPQGLCPRCVLACAAAAAEVQRSATATGEIPSLERVAAAFPALEVVELVGRGAMGFVFKARQPHLDRFVALKLLPDKLARDPQFAERFNREGRVLARLNHPNIVSVFDFGRTEHFYFLLMEFVDGVNLRQAMQAGRFSPSEALAIVPKICEALQYAHEQGVLHRDIKPENILLDAKGRVKIADFGIAKLVGEDQPSVTLTGTGAALGTPHYMAPEQLERPSEVDHRADVYSLGVVFYEMLTGELPIGRFAPPSAKTPVKPAVDEVVFRTLEKDREKRYQSAGEVKTQVEHLTQNGAVSGPTPSAPGASKGPHGTLVVAPAERPRFAFRAFAGAALVGLSLVTPLTVLVALVTGRGGIAPAELWLSLASVALLGLGGTLVGWLALNEIRDGRGLVRGLPLALFATLTWPLLALVCVTVGMPMFLLKLAAGSGGTHWLGRVLVLVLPAGTLTFALWAVYATARWASQAPKPHERGILKWVFAAVLVIGIVAVYLIRPEKRSPLQGTPPGAALPAGAVELVALSRHPSDGFWWRPDGSASSEGPFPSAGVTNPPGPGERAVEMIFRTQGLPPEASLADFEMEGQLGARGNLDRSGMFHYVTRFPAAQRMTTIRARVASDPWETLASDATGPQGGGELSRVREGRSLRINFLSAIEDKATNTVLTVSHNLAGHDVRVVAWTTAGREQTSLLTTQGRDHLVATFVGLPRARIQEFRFQARPYRWAEFKDVRLSASDTAARPGSEPLRVRFKVPKGQVATFEVVRRDTAPPTGVPMFAGFFLAPDHEAARGQFVLEPATSLASRTAAPAWTMRIEAEDGPKAGGTFADFGALLSSLPPSPNNFWEIPSDQSFQIDLTRPYPPGVDTTELAPSVALSLVVRSTAWRDQVSGPRRGITVSTGSTNWSKTLHGLPPAARKPADPANWIRFTFTAVELREDDRGRWLAFDYVDDAHGECEPAFRWEATLAGFTPQTRTTAFRTDAKDGSPAVRHQRVEFLMPDFLSGPALLQFRDDLARGLVAKSVAAHAGEDQPIFRLPVGDRGTLGGWIGARTRTATHPLRDEAGHHAVSPGPSAADRLRSAQLRLQEIKQEIEVGALPPQGREILEAEAVVGLAEAEVRGDVGAAAKVRSEYAGRIRVLVEKLHEVGKATTEELDQAKLSEVRAKAALTAVEESR